MDVCGDGDCGAVPCGRASARLAVGSAAVRCAVLR